MPVPTIAPTPSATRCGHDNVRASRCSPGWSAPTAMIFLRNKSLIGSAPCQRGLVAGEPEQRIRFRIAAPPENAASDLIADDRAHLERKDRSRTGAPDIGQHGVANHHPAEGRRVGKEGGKTYRS